MLFTTEELDSDWRARGDSPKTAEDTICNIYIRPDNRVELSKCAEDLIRNIYIKTENDISKIIWLEFLNLKEWEVC